MGTRVILLLSLLLVLVAPAWVYGWGRIEEIRYKIKPTDGNLWAPSIGNGQVIRGIEAPHSIAFTFDDGPDHRTTPILLDQLDRYGIKATFFINGSRFHPRTAGGKLNRSVLREIYRRGHFIGNHTFNHKDLTTLDDDGWRTEVRQVEQVIRSLIGRRTWLFRPPFGKVDNRVYSQLDRDGYTVVMWNLDPLDWKAKTPGDLLKRTKTIIEQNPTGGVFLMHDTNRNCVEAFPLIIEWIEERNAKLRAMSEPELKIVGIDSYVRSKKSR